MAQKGMEQYFVPRKRRLPAALKEVSSDKTGSEKTPAPKRLKQDLVPAVGREQMAEVPRVKFHQSRLQVLASLAGTAKRADCSTRITPSAGTVGGGSKEVPHQPIKTPKSIQRKLFDDDERDAAPAKAEPKSKIIKDKPLPRVVPGMSPQKMKESLMNCSKIQQLKEKLADFNNASAKLKSFQAAKRNLVKSKTEKTLEFIISSPVKTPKKFPQTPSPKKTPAYQRFQHLIKESPATLQLPYKYRFLKEAFHCLDTVSSFLHNRKEIITFKKLKTSVQGMLNKTFTEKELAQIRTVFPFAYIFRREKNLPNHKVTPNNKNKYQLTLQVNTEYANDMKCSLEPQSPAAPSVYRKLSPAMLLERCRVFHASLLDILLQHHQEFLLSLEPPVIVDAARINRWHAEFPLETVPDIAPAPLPQPPEDDLPGTARDVLERARTVFSKYPKLQQCLEAVAAASEKSSVSGGAESGSHLQSGPSISEPGPLALAAAPSEPAKAGLPAGLLARIRAREAARQARHMTRTSEESRRMEMLGRLPALTRSLRAAFVSEHRAALELETAVTRLADSSRSQLSSDELVQHVRLLAAEVPAFLQVLQLKAGTFVKLNRDEDVNKVVKQLEMQLEKLKK